MATGPVRLTGGAVAVAAAFVIGGGVGARAAGNALAGARESGAHRTATATTRAFEASADALRRAVASVTTLAPEIAKSPGSPPPGLQGAMSPEGVSAVVLLGLDGKAVLVSGTLPPTVPIDGLAAPLSSALDLARDTADPHGAPVGRAMAFATAVYDKPVASTSDRRASVSSWVVSLVDAEAFVGRFTARGDEAVLRVGGVTVTTGSERGPVAVESTVNVAGQPLTLVVLPHVQGGVGAVAGVVLLVAFAGATGVLFVRRRADVEVRASRATAEALERETRTVAEIGPLLQQSLDLAEVLPAVAVRLSDEFGLVSFAVELLGEHGRPVDVFAVGRRAGGEPVPVVGTEGVPAGVEVALPLLRAGRTIGRLRLTPRERLAPSQVDGLRGASDLIAVATYNVELYEREQATVRRLQDLDRLKDAFLGTISHELRTPITAISGFVQLLNDRWDDLTEEQRRDFLHRVGRNSASLGLLVDDLLDFARLEQQALSTNVAPVPLDTIVASFAAQVIPALGDHPLTMDLESGVVALADPRAVERVLANLLTNAAKFSPPGSSVSVGLRARGESAVLTVSDLGPGIAEADRLRVFTRFYRGESDVARSTRGAGIGLAVVHELVTQMGGDIHVSGREPNGTTIAVRLPLADPVRGADTDLAPERHAPEDRIPSRSTQ